MKSIDELRELLDREIGEADPYFKGVAICNEIEAEIADGYTRLPVDADGVPIHVGDICEMGGVQFKVRQLCTDGNCWWAVDGTGEFYIAELCHHVKPRTLEDVLREYGKAYHAHMADNYMNYDGTDEQVVEKYADRIRELLGFGIDEPDTIRNELMDGDEI